MRQRIDASGRDIRLEVDGGIKVDNIRAAADAGCDTFVAGSAIFGAERLPRGDRRDARAARRLTPRRHGVAMTRHDAGGHAPRRTATRMAMPRAGHAHRYDGHAPWPRPRGHGARRPNLDRAFAIGIAINVAFVAVEAFYGWRADSLALLADAGHNLGDVLGLVLAWAGAFAGRLAPDARHTYGWKRASILAAFAQLAAAAGRDRLARLGGDRPPARRRRRSPPTS